MSQTARQARIARAQLLAEEHAAAEGVLRFYMELLRFDGELQVILEGDLASGCGGFARAVPPEMLAEFPGFLKMVEAQGPESLAKEAHEVGNISRAEHSELLNAFWLRRETATGLVGAKEFLTRAFLQPYAEFVRDRSGKQNNAWMPRVCPHCLHKPGMGVLRPLGDGGQRFLLCSFCLGEWEFRRIVCPACGEEDQEKLSVYVAEEFRHLRVECCDSCRCYIKTVDLTRNGLADPVIDEIAAIPLDLWAQEKGYSKLQTNLMML